MATNQIQQDTVDTRDDRGTGYEKVETSEERAIREQVRSEAMAKIRSAVSSSKLLTESDERSFAASLAESELSRWYKTHEEKMGYLRKSSSEIIPQTISELRRMEGDFFAKVTALESAGMDRASADRWRAYMQKGGKLWYKKKAFLNNTFPGLYQRWRSLLAEEKTLKNKIGRVKNANGIPEIAKFKSSEYQKASVDARTAMVHSALAAIAAQEKGREKLYAEAKARLSAAASGENRVLSPTKISLWMRRIFESNADEGLIKDFIHGSSGNQLGGLIRNWESVRSKFDGVEDLRKEGKLPPSFHVVTLDTFLNWHYDARVAYVREAENRKLESAAENATPGVLLDIRREMDMRDWRSAESLITRAKAMTLSEEHRGQLRSMEEYLRTQRVESPKTPQEEEHDQDPKQDIRKALGELKEIDGGLHDLYVRAMAKGTGALSTLSALMYNRCWTRNNSVLDDTDEEELRQRSEKETKKIVDEGHTKDFENNQIDGYGSAAIRDQSHGEWSPQILHVGSDPAAHDALVSKCEAQQNNRAFKYWGTLIPEGVGYSQHQYVVFNLQWRLKSGLRSSGAMSEAELMTLKQPAAKQEEQSHAVAA